MVLIIRKLLKIGLITFAILVVFPCLMLIALGYFPQAPDDDNAMNYVNELWQLDLPNTQYQLLYEESSDCPFFGEGERFQVIQFDNDLSEQLSWQSAGEKSLAYYFRTIAGSLPIEETYIPDFDCPMRAKTYEKVSDTGSTLWLIYFDELELNGEAFVHLLYIIELME